MYKVLTELSHKHCNCNKPDSVCYSKGLKIKDTRNTSPETKGLTMKFDSINFSGSYSNNNIINNSFDSVFQSRDIRGFMNQVNQLLPSLHKSNAANNPAVNLKTNYLMYGLPSSGIIKDNNTTVNVTKEGRIQISHDELKNILVDDSSLKSAEWNKSSISEFLYNDIPVINDIPLPKALHLPGRLAISNKRIISGGVRFLDPWPQSAWEKTSLNRTWPPDPYTTKGPLNLTSDSTNQAILLDTSHPSCLNVGKTYGIIPKAIVTINPEDSSVILATQIENQNANPNLSLAPWVIAPITTPSNKKTLAAFPISKEISSSLNSAKTDSMATWLESVYKNSKWKADNQNEIMIIDPAAKGKQSKLNTDNTNWAVYAIEGSDKVIVMRSLYNHKDQFQAFIRGSSDEKQSEYLELEYTGPRVTPGNKSTVVVKWDFVPVSLLSNNQFTNLGQTGNMENEVKIISNQLKALIENSK